MRVLGDVKAGALAATAKSAGFDLRRITSYVASGPSTPAILTRLQETLKKASGVTQVDLRGVAGGAMLRIQGTMEDEALFAAAKSAGFRFRPLTDPVGGRFRVSGTTDADAEGKLRKALQAVAGIGELQIQTNSEGAQLSVSGGTTIPEVIVAVAKAAGFDLRPADPVAASFDSADVERNTPPAPNDRILEDVTRVGDLAPDFTLGAKDGKSKITLSEFRDKKPVVLIFGSYT